MAPAQDPVSAITVPVSEFRSNCGPLLEAVRDGQEIVITKNGRPVAEVRPPRAPLAEYSGSLFGFCRDIISLPEGFDFDEANVSPSHEEVVNEILTSWDEKEPSLVVGPSEPDG